MKGQTSRSIIDNGLQRSLRRRLTDAEIRLWQRLRARQVEGFKFRRQHPFLDYVLDFVCLEARLIIEVDGGQHQGAVQDGVRDRRLHAAGFRVIGFWNNQVLKEFDAVVDAIRSALIEKSERAGSHLTPSPPQPSP